MISIPIHVSPVRQILKKLNKKNKTTDTHSVQTGYFNYAEGETDLPKEFATWRTLFLSSTFLIPIANLWQDSVDPG